MYFKLREKITDNLDYCIKRSYIPKWRNKNLPWLKTNKQKPKQRWFMITKPALPRYSKISYTQKRKIDTTMKICSPDEWISKDE
jgi:hypothetical protein